MAYEHLRETQLAEKVQDRAKRTFERGLGIALVHGLVHPKEDDWQYTTSEQKTVKVVARELFKDEMNPMKIMLQKLM